MANLALFGIGAVLVIIAVGVAFIGRRHHRQHRAVTGTDTTDVRAIDSEGRVELKGTVRADDAFESPVTGAESVLAAWEVEEWDESRGSEMWETRASGVYATPFSLDDDTGSVRVDVGEHVEETGGGTGIHEIQLGALDVDRFLANGVAVDGVRCLFDRFAAQTTIPPDADPPERIAEFVADEDAVAEQSDAVTNVVDVGNAHGERRYYEGTLQPGDDVYLLGRARATENATHPLKPEDVVVEPPADGELLVSDESEAELVDELGQYKLVYAGAAALGVVGLAVGAFGAGVV